MFATRFNHPVRTYVKNCVRAAAIYLTFGGVPHFDSASLRKGAQVFPALAAESIQSGPFSGAAAEKDIASEARNAPVPGGSNVSEKRNTPRIGKPENFQIVCRSKNAQVASGSKKEHIFANVFFYDFARRAGSPNK